MFDHHFITAIIPAAGSGKRMHTGKVSKVYLKLLGKAVLQWTVEAFERNEYVDRIIVAVRPEEVEYCRSEIIPKEKYPKVDTVIPGGQERYDTVLKALRQAGDGDIVLVHDGARPLVDQETINASVMTAVRKGCCIAAVPVKDTIKAVKDGVVRETPDRSSLFAVHTPQAFVCREIRRDMEKGLAEGFFGTDEASFAEKQGKKVFIVASKYDNIKVTTSDDLTIAEALLMKRNQE